MTKGSTLVHDYPDVSITLIGDSIYKEDGFGKPSIKKINKIEDGRFCYIPLNFIHKKLWRGGYSVQGLIGILKKIKPDFIYMIGTEVSDATFQAIWAQKYFLPHSRLALFTMNGVELPFHNLNYRLRWTFLRPFVDAYFCHCPRTVEILRTLGKVKKPIYMQTQVGVPTDIFKPNQEIRKRVRQRLGVNEDEYLFGSVSRMDIRKGLMDMLDALPVQAQWKFVMIGSGPDQNVLEKEVKKRGLDDRVLLPGYVPYPYGVAEMINALDCSVLMSKTTPGWQDTFALAVAQSMAVGLPVIVSESGGLAYQVGKEGIVVPEGDVAKLHEVMEYLSGNPEKGRKIGESMRERLQNSFSVPHLNRCFYHTAIDILSGTFNVAHTDQQNFSFSH